MDRQRVRLLRKHLRVIEREVERQLKAQTSCCGVTPAQCHALLELADLGESSLAGLARRLGLDASTLSRTVDGLVRSGYVSRRAEPDNRRAVRLALTPAGRRTVDSIDGLCDRFYQDALAGIPGARQAELAESLAMISELFTRMGEVCVTADAARCRAGRRQDEKQR